jgi:hypothetical protein
MLTPTEWNEILAPEVPWLDCYPAIGLHARDSLEALPAGHSITTTELLDRLYPAKLAAKSDAGTAARKRILAALFAKKNPWRARYSTPQPKRAKGRLKGTVPLLWHGPKTVAVECCPTCGQEMF